LDKKNNLKKNKNLNKKNNDNDRRESDIDRDRVDVRRIGPKELKDDSSNSNSSVNDNEIVEETVVNVRKQNKKDFSIDQSKFKFRDNKEIEISGSEISPIDTKKHSMVSENRSVNNSKNDTTMNITANTTMFSQKDQRDKSEQRTQVKSEPNNPK